MGPSLLFPIMKLLSDSASERLCGGALVSLNIPISLNNIIATQTNAAAGVAVAPLFGFATTNLGQANGLAAFQRAGFFRR
jgi:hypothetical protein